MPKKKILLIEDEENIATTLSDRFKFEGYAVVVAREGKEGIEKAKREKPDIILLDIMLPDMNGHDICRTLKNDDEVTAPVIMMTSKIDAVDITKANESGADDFEVKTGDYAALSNAVKRLFEKSPQE